MQMDAGLDTGAMLLTEATPIVSDDTSATLHDRLAGIGARLLVQALARLAAGTLPATPQPAAGVSYAHKIDKSEAAIDWHAPAEAIERRLRAFDPFPGGTAVLAGQPVKVWRARLAAGSGEPGQVLPCADGRLVLACGAGALELIELQLAGGRRITAREFLQQHPL
jgi:methionyl-tRNA formyltransferase